MGITEGVLENVAYSELPLLIALEMDKSVIPIKKQVY